MDVRIRAATPQDYEALLPLFEEIDTLHRQQLPERFQKPFLTHHVSLDALVYNTEVYKKSPVGSLWDLKHRPLLRFTLGQERLLVDDGQHILQLANRARRPDGMRGDAAGERPRAQGHTHPRANRRDREVIRNPVRQRLELRHWNGHGDNPQNGLVGGAGQFWPSSNARTRFMSSHTSRLADGLRNRYAGWKVGMRIASR